MSTTSMTKLMPVTVRFDGCFCSEACEHWCGGCYINPLADTPLLGYPKIDLMDGPIVMIPQSQGHAYIRTRWCCETFGMGEPMQEQPEAIDDYELETMDAKDAEALRRWTSE